MKTVAVILALVALPAAAQYKCVSAGGAVSFQQNPCDQGAKQAKLDLPATAPSDGREHIRAAIANRRFVIGMSKDEVLQSWGTRPSPRINRSVVGGVIHEQMVMTMPGYTTVYLYLEDGVVTSFQDTK